LIRNVLTGVPGLDTVLGGGLPEFSFNLVAGGPGSGKTTLAQQIIFRNATAKRPALYFTVLGEPTLKMLRYQQQFTFFDAAKVGTAVQYINLSTEVLQEQLTEVLARIVSEVERVQPGIVVVDSFRTIRVNHSSLASDDDMTIEHFIQRLALHLTSWEATTLLLGEYGDAEQRDPIFTVADGVIWVSQVTDRNSVVRKAQIVKMRGRSPMPGLHTFRINDGGLQVFPRIPEQQMSRHQATTKRLSTGVPGLDEMMGGGVPAGDALMLAGPAGSGKTTFATQFAAAGLRSGEAVVIAVFEEYPEEDLDRTKARNHDIEDMIEEDKLALIYLRPLDLSVDETLFEILDAVDRLGATRVIIDSLSGFEIALAPAFRDDFRESLYRLVGALTATGVTVFMTTEVVGVQNTLNFTTERVSFITDDIIVQRQVEIDGELQKVLVIVKMRGSEHSREFRKYDINAQGAVVSGALRDYQGIMGGTPELQPRSERSMRSGLTDEESNVLDVLLRVRSAPAETLSARTGLKPEQLTKVLARLAGLGYAIATKEGGHVLYGAISRPGT
jgi:circadian clock protein KaiC